MVRARRARGWRMSPRCNGETHVWLHRRAALFETLRNDAFKRALRRISAAKCATHARTTHAP
eukprot:10177893-Lingulodinium_polyedra.AAC.1